MRSVKDLVVVVELVGRMQTSSRVHLLNCADLHVVLRGLRLPEYDFEYDVA
jgi:hypothetical protein